MTTLEQKIEHCAEAAHEMNKIWCEKLGDQSQLPWSLAPEWQKKSARMGVQGVLNGNGPRQSHEGWLKEKKDTGWKYGPVKDADKKEHPCFVDYDQLPPEQKAKDFLFTNVVKMTWEALEQLDLAKKAEANRSGSTKVSDDF